MKEFTPIDYIKDISEMREEVDKNIKESAKKDYDEQFDEFVAFFEKNNPKQLSEVKNDE